MTDFLDTFNFEEYASYILGNHEPERHGDEILAFCPLHDDQNTKSLNFNVKTGLFKCHGCQKTGNVITFHATLRGLPNPMAVQELKMWQKNRPPRPHHEEKPKEKERKPPISPDVIESMHQALLNSPATIKKLEKTRGWSLDVLKKFKVGWHQGHRRVSIPIKENGEYVDVRLYAPAPKEIGKDKDGNPIFEPKIKSWAKGYGGTRLFPEPEEAVQEINGQRWIKIVAGEPDCLCAWSHGIKCVTVTGGEGSWNKDWNDEYGVFSGATNVIIIYDNDETGRRGTLKVASNLLTYAPDRKVVSILWPTGFKEKGDITDWFIESGNSREGLNELEKIYWTKEMIDKGMVLQSTKIQNVNEIRQKEKERVKKEASESVSGIERAPNEYIGITWKEKGGEWKEVRASISNFVLDIEKIEDLGYGKGNIYHVKPKILGKTMPVKPMEPREGSRPVSINEWMKSNYGRGAFTGTQQQLSKMWALEDARQHPIVVKRPSHSGYYQEDNLWIFQECVIKDCKVYPIDKDTGLANVEGQSYAPRSFDRDNPDRMDGLVANPDFRLEDQEIEEARKSIIRLLPKNIGGKWAYLLLGWAAAVAYYPEIMNIKRKNIKFPLLFISGPAEAGKNTMGSFVMDHFGLSESVCRSMVSSTTNVGIERSLAYYGALPTWLDEYRSHDKKAREFDGILRSAFDGSGTVKGTLDVDKGKISQVNGTMLLTGETTPEDQATMGRCCLVQLRKTKTDKSVYPDLLRQAERASGIFIKILKEKTPDKIKSVLNKITELQAYLVEVHQFDPRLAGIYAVVAVGFTELYNPGDIDGVNGPFINWIFDEGGKFQYEKENEANANQFLGEIKLLVKSGYISKYFDVIVFGYNEQAALAIRMDEVHSAWLKWRKERGLEAWNKKAIRQALYDRSYLLEKSWNVTFKDKKKKAVVLSLAKMPESIKDDFRSGWDIETGRFEDEVSDNNEYRDRWGYNKNNLFTEKD